MAYENDDLKPTRPSASRLGGAGADSITDARVVGITRAGDDDLRPLRPSEDVLNNRIVQSAAAGANAISGDARSQDCDCGDASGKTEPEKYGLLRLCKYICGAVVAIWLLGTFGSTLHSIAIAQTLLECLAFLGIALLELFIVSYVVLFWRRTFSALPEVRQLKRKDYVDALPVLSDKLRSSYIKSFPSRDEYAQAAGFPKDAPVLQMLARLKDHKYADSVGFIEEFENFQRSLDARSLEIIKKYAKMIAVKTAASPWKAIDVISVFFNSTLMVCELAKVYHRKTTRHEASRLVVRWFVNLYISGELGQIAEGGADIISDGASEWLGSEGVAAFVQPAVPLLAKFGGKIVEGGVNAYLAYRLGRRASEYFKELVD